MSPFKSIPANTGAALFLATMIGTTSLTTQGPAFAANGVNQGYGCELSYALHYRMTGGVAFVSVNDVFIQKLEGATENRLNVISWTLPGLNNIEIAYQGNGDAIVQLLTGCAGTFDTKPASEPVTVRKGDTARLTFELERGDENFSAMSPSPDDGLATAYSHFRKAVLSRDIKTVLATIEPAIANAESKGLPREIYVDHVTRAIEIGEFEIDAGAEAAAAANGRVHQWLTGDTEPAIVSRFTFDKADWTIPFGTYWSKVGGEWKVVQN